MVVQYQQRPDPIGMRRALSPELIELPMRAPGVFLRRRGHSYHRPDSPLAPEVAHQHRQQLAAVEPIGLGPPRPAIDFDAGRVHHDVVDALLKQPPVQPEAVAARLVATVHHDITHQAAARLRLGDGVQHRPLVPRVHRVAARSPRLVA
jgi:hypothetical protein